MVRGALAGAPREWALTVGGEGRESGKRRRSAVTVEELGAADHDRWAEAVRTALGGSPYSLPGYLDALCAATGGTFRIFAAIRGDEIVGGVAAYERSSPIGRFVAPRLLLYYNGIVLREYDTRYPSERTSRQLEAVDAIAAVLEQRGYGRLELRSRSPFTDVRALQARGWSAQPSYSYVVALGDLEAQWARVEQNLRRLVERARSQGIELDPDAGADGLYRLHHETHQRKGAPLYLPKEQFLAFVGALRDKGLGRVYAARLADGRVAAAQLVLLGHPVTHTVVAAADGDLQHTGANPFLRWSVFEQLAAEGAVANDLTDATLGPVARFKSQFGGRLETSYVTQRLSTTQRLQLGAYRSFRRARTIVRRGG